MTSSPGSLIGLADVESLSIKQKIIYRCLFQVQITINFEKTDLFERKNENNLKPPTAHINYGNNI